MGRIVLAFRAFALALTGALTAERLDAVLKNHSAEAASGDKLERAPATSAATESSPPTPSDRRSDALTLLATLQREARLVDLVQEPLSDYSDEQVGAAARDVLRDCRKVLDRMFALQPVLDELEDADVETPAEFSSARFRLSGSVEGQPPYRGKLIHPGWMASQCELPRWSGQWDDHQIIAPAEVEVTPGG